LTATEIVRERDGVYVRSVERKETANVADRIRQEHGYKYTYTYMYICITRSHAVGRRIIVSARRVRTAVRWGTNGDGAVGRLALPTWRAAVVEFFCSMVGDVQLTYAKLYPCTVSLQHCRRTIIYIQRLSFKTHSTVSQKKIIPDFNVKFSRAIKLSKNTGHELLTRLFYAVWNFTFNYTIWPPSIQQMVEFRLQVQVY